MGGAIATSPTAVAAASDVVVFASGDQQAVDYCVPLFEAFARSHHYLGKFGVGSKMKFVANLLVAVHNVAAAEALMLARAAGDGELDSAAVFRRYLKAAGEQA